MRASQYPVKVREDREAREAKKYPALFEHLFYETLTGLQLVPNATQAVVNAFSSVYFEKGTTVIYSTIYWLT